MWLIKIINFCAIKSVYDHTNSGVKIE